MQKTLFLAIFLAVLASGCISVPPTVETEAEVTEVVDGDTAMLKFDNRTEEVRFNGVDTPETNTANSPREFEGVPANEAGRDCLSRWGENASRFVKSKIAGENITLKYSPLPYFKRGDYGRLLGTIHYNETNLNRELVRKGYGRMYGEDGEYKEEEIDAKLNVSGVWGCQGVNS